MKLTIERVLLLLAILYIMFLRSCSTPKIVKEIKSIKTLEVKGKFETVVPVQKVLKPIYIKGKTQYYAVEDTTYINEMVAKVNYYKNANDSIQSLLYNNEITVKEYSQTLNDTNVEINVKGRNTGSVLSMNIDYTVKAKFIELPHQKTFRYRILGGGEVGISKELNQGVMKANLMYQNKKSNITSLSYMKIGNTEFVTVGHNINLFTRNK